MKFLRCETVEKYKGKKIAIIGAGPAGLFAAGYLVCKGWDVHIFDKMPEAGGLMIFGALDTSVNKEKIRKGIKELEKVGVIFHLGKKVDNKKFEELRKKFDAVLIATGAWKEKRLNISGENLKGVYYAFDYIVNYHLYKYGYRKELPKLKGTTLVIGGGLTAVDACYIANEVGSKKILLSYRRRVEDSKAKNELLRLKEKGVELLELTVPVKMEGDSKVKNVVLAKTEIVEEEHKHVPKIIEGSEFSVEVDNVLIAIGEIPTPAFRGIEIDTNGKIRIDEKFRTNLEKVFAAGDVEQGPSFIGKAMLRGIKAAKAIEELLG